MWQAVHSPMKTTQRELVTRKGLVAVQSKEVSKENVGEEKRKEANLLCWSGVRGSQRTVNQLSSRLRGIVGQAAHVPHDNHAKRAGHLADGFEALRYVGHGWRHGVVGLVWTAWEAVVSTQAVALSIGVNKALLMSVWVSSRRRRDSPRPERARGRLRGHPLVW